MSFLQPLRTALPRFTIRSPAARTFSTTRAPANMAKMTIIGRLGGTPEPTQTGTGRTVFRYAVATNSGPRDDRQTSWFNVSMFIPEGERGEAQGQYLASLEKGTLVFVEADGKMGTYDGEDGRKHKVLNLVQRNLQVLSRPNRPAAEDESAELSA